jgi:hypothetical protein
MMVGYGHIPRAAALWEERIRSGDVTMAGTVAVGTAMIAIALTIAAVRCGG